jgi:ubiquinone/menaquinone biosynthesis C-methylase UbiE
MPTGYENIRIAGGDTATPLAMAKRLEIIKRHLRRSDRRFLDCGCGAGEYVLALVDQFGLDAHGIEYEEEKVRQAQGKPAAQKRVERGDLQKVQFPDASWDCALLNEVLEHVPDDRQALREVRRILKPGGMLFIFSPNRWFPFETHGVRLKHSGRRVPHWLPFIPYLPLPVGKLVFHYWARNYWQNELTTLVTAAGFRIVERSFVWLTFEGISGHQPVFIRAVKPWLRRVSNTMERLPLVRRFGVSQVLICQTQ